MKYILQEYVLGNVTVTFTMFIVHNYGRWVLLISSMENSIQWDEVTFQSLTSRSQDSNSLSESKAWTHPDEATWGKKSVSALNDVWLGSESTDTKIQSHWILHWRLVNVCDGLKNQI